MSLLTTVEVNLLNRMNPSARKVGLGTKLQDALSTEVNTIEDGAVTDAKLATDVKVGSLAAYEGVEGASVVTALNELLARVEVLEGIVGS